jgi:ammonia channel protein AmtB
LAIFRVVEPATLKKYTAHLVKIITFVIRFTLGWTTGYTILITEEQRELAGLIRQAILENETPEKVIHLIHLMSYALFSHQPTTPQEDKYYSAVIRYLVIASLTEQGHFLAAGNITQIIAAIVYCIRSTMLYQMHVLMAERGVRLAA